MRAYYWVAAGGALGSTFRALLSLFIPLQHNFHIVWINVIGSFLLAFVFSSLSSDKQGEAPLRWLLGTGLMGGFTTMSTFSLDVVLLIESGKIAGAAAYIVVSIIGGLLAAIAGVKLTKSIQRGRRRA